MCVAPRSPFGPFDIAVGDIHASYVAYFPIDDRYFAVVPVIDSAGELGKCDFKERTYGDSRILHLFEKPFFHRPTTHIVV